MYSKQEFSSPSQVRKHIQDLEAGKTNAIKTLRVYLNYAVEEQLVTEAFADQYRSVLRIKTHRPDYHVPSDEEVIQNYTQLRDTELRDVYALLMCAGIRITEAVRFLNDYQYDTLNVQGNVAYTPITERRGTKSINTIFIPDTVARTLQPVNTTPDTIRNRYADEKTLFTMKYLRKWHYNFLLYHNVPESVADFIQGRAGSTVSANHYLAGQQQAKHWYDKLAPTLTDMLHNQKHSPKHSTDLREPDKDTDKQPMEYSEQTQ